MNSESGDWFEKFQKTGRIPLKSREAAEKACRQYHKGSEQHHLALSVWIRFSLIEVENAKSASQALRAYREAPEGTLVDRRAREKWDALTMAEAYLARSYAQAKEVHRRARSLSRAAEVASDIRLKFAEQIIRRAKSLEDFKHLFELMAGSDYNTPEQAPLQSAWARAALGMLAEVSTCEEAYEIFILCSEEQRIRKVAGLRMDDLYEGERRYSVEGVHSPDGVCYMGVVSEKERKEIRAQYPQIFGKG